MRLFLPKRRLGKIQGLKISEISVRILNTTASAWLSKNKSNEGVSAYQATPFFAEISLPQKPFFKKPFSVEKRPYTPFLEIKFISKLSAVK